MPTIRLVFDGEAAKGALDLMLAKAAEATLEIVTSGALVLVAEAQAGFAGSHARNEPHTGGDQPNVVTGTLRRSIRMTGATRTGPTSAMAVVGPTVIYGRRIELGFTGPDSLGRRYNQPGFPYLTPAMHRSQAALFTLAQRIWTDALSS